MTSLPSPAAPMAPWTDFLGQPIRHGDRLTHPDGNEFVAVRLHGYTDEGDAWRAIYDDASVSRLCLQIGDKGRAALSTSTGQAEPTADARDALKLKSWISELSWAVEALEAYGHVDDDEGDFTDRMKELLEHLKGEMK